jgi:hypothetical protein
VRHLLYLVEAGRRAEAAQRILIRHLTCGARW